MKIGVATLQWGGAVCVHVRGFLQKWTGLALIAAALGMSSPVAQADGSVAPKDGADLKVVLRVPHTDGTWIFPGEETGSTPQEVCDLWLQWWLTTERGSSAGASDTFRADVSSDAGGCFARPLQHWAGYRGSAPIQWPQCPGDAAMQFRTEPNDPREIPPRYLCTCNAATAPHAKGSSAVANECLSFVEMQRAHPRCPDCESQFGKPIFPMTGAERLTLPTGLRIGPEALTFTYDSGIAPTLSPTVPYVFPRVEPLTLGANWLSNLHRRIAWQAGAAYAPRTAHVTRGDGKVASFVYENATNTGAPGSRDRLIQMGTWRFYDGTRRLIEDYQADSYDLPGRLASVTTADGQRLSFEYSASNVDPTRAPGAGYLLAVQDAFGRRLEFSYTRAPVSLVGGGHLLTKVKDPAGQDTVLAYAGLDLLDSVTWADGSVDHFVYEDSRNPRALTGQVDGNGKRYASIGYDDKGRATSTELAGGVARYSVSYGAPPELKVVEQYNAATNEILRTWQWQAPQDTRVTLPNGSSTQLNSTYVNGYPRTGGQTQPAGSGSEAASSETTRDANGNVASRVDFKGQRSCYANDLVRNLETVRVEGLPQAQACSSVTAANAALSAGARKISTQWHPVWSLPVATAEPGKITYDIYNGQGDPVTGGSALCAPEDAKLPDNKPIAVLCKRIEVSTTDADGHLGFTATAQPGVANAVSRWTYNLDGQVLTAKRPRTAVNDTTTYTYYIDTTADHTRGDLKTMTNPSGKLTSYDKYNKLGQLLQSTDPNGILTINTYDLRQRLLTSSIGGETTTYAYDAVGQLTKVTQATGSWIGYEYDDAHRQTAAKDHLGNRIDYQLDDTGIRTGESVKDPAGSLKRSLARVMDALNRAQQASGGE